LNGSERVMLSQAHLILRVLGDAVALAILAGPKLFDEALKEATAARDLQASEEAQMTRLRDGAPDLADLVIEGRMTLTEALAAHEERKKRVREAIEDGKRAAELGLIGFVTAVATIGNAMTVTSQSRGATPSSRRRASALASAAASCARARATVSGSKRWVAPRIGSTDQRSTAGTARGGWRPANCSAGWGTTSSLGARAARASRSASTCLV
jgi:hypothetical protein